MSSLKKTKRERIINKVSKIKANTLLLKINKTPPIIIFILGLMFFELYSFNAGSQTTELYSTPLYSDSNLKAYYRLENENDSKNSYNLTNYNSVTFENGLFNKGGIGATTKSLSIASSLDLGTSDNTTYALWVKLSTEISANFYQFLVHYRGNPSPLNMIRYDYNGGTRRINFYSGAYNASVQYNLTMGTTNWYHFAMTRVGATGQVRCYVNGVDIGGFTDTGNAADASEFQLLGQGTSNNVIGIMDDVAVFNRVLSAIEISGLYNGFAPTVTTIDPTSGDNNASVSITSITGTNFVSGATVKITKTGQSDINCNGFTFTNSTALSNGTCPITGAYTGTWNVVVSNPNSQTGTLTNGFIIKSPATVNWNNSNVQEITLTANRSFTFTNGKSGGTYKLIIKQDATGGRAVYWPTNVKFVGGIAPTLSTAANAVDMVKFVFEGTNYLDDGVRLDIK